jgi:hypothetical protein
MRRWLNLTGWHGRLLRLPAAFLACGLIALGGAVALDRFLTERRRRAIRAEIPTPDRRAMPVPSPQDWHPALIEPGTPAPDFDLPDARTGGRVRLRDYRGRSPVVLLLSSFGCNVFCGELTGLLRLHEAFQGRTAFVFVHVTDAGHPDPSASPFAGEPSLAGAPLEARLRRTRRGLEFYKLPFAGLVDEAGEAERAYGAFPKRLVVVGVDGRVVFDGGWGAKGGPSDWDLGEVEKHLRAALTKAAAPES